MIGFQGNGRRLIACFLVGVALVGFRAAQGMEAEGAGKHPPTSPPKPAAATSAAAWADSALPKNDPRRNLHISLVADKPEYFLGENVILHYCIENCGKHTFHLDHPDNKNDPLFINISWRIVEYAVRDISFYVEMLDQSGRKAEDPYANIKYLYSGGMGMGGVGMGGTGMFGDIEAPRPELAPGNKYCEDLRLMRYREPGKTGTYTIKVYRDLGSVLVDLHEELEKSRDIPAGKLNSPIVTTTIRFLMPNPQQARHVVEEMLKLPADDDVILGRRDKPFADFSLLRYPVYLPIMRELAEKGDVRGVQAIGAMFFPEATQALLDLARNKVPAIALKALAYLIERLPSNYLSAENMQFCNSRFWRPDLKSRALQLGWELLDGEECAGRMRGCQIIGSFGGKDDLPKFIERMDVRLTALLNRYNAQRQEWRGWERVPGTYHEDDGREEFESFSNAAAGLIASGARPQTSADTPGRAVALLAGLNANNDFRPPRRQQTVVSLLNHELPYLRERALQEVTLPLSDAAVEQVAARIQDDYEPVQLLACDLSAETNLARFRQPLIEVLKTSTNELVLQKAFDAARACGADLDQLLEILVGRLDRFSVYRNKILLSMMVDAAIEDAEEVNIYQIFLPYDDWRSFLGDMQRAWREFIAANRQALREGRRLKAGFPPLCREMFPPEA